MDNTCGLCGSTHLWVDRHADSDIAKVCWDCYAWYILDVATGKYLWESI